MYGEGVRAVYGVSRRKIGHYCTHAELNAAIADNRLTTRLYRVSTKRPSNMPYLPPGENVTMNHNAENNANLNNNFT